MQYATGQVLMTMGKTAITVTSLFIDLGRLISIGFAAGISQRFGDIVAKIDRGAYHTHRRRQKAMRRMRRAMGDRS